MNKKFIVVAIVVFGAMFIATDAQAFSTKADASVYISAGEVVEGNLYAVGQSITVDGAVTGDIICAGQNVVINGEIGGDVICAAQALSISGPVGGNVRAVGNVINIGSMIARNIMAFGAAISIGPDSNIGGDVLVGAASLDMRGNIAGELHGGLAYANIDGSVGKNINLRIDENGSDKSAQGKLTIGKNALIGGGIYYYANPLIKFENSGQVVGEIMRLDPEDKMPSNLSLLAAWIWAKSIALLSTLLVALALVGLFGKRLNKITEPMTKGFWASVGWGLAFLVIVPLLVGITMITIIGIKAGVLVGFLWAFSIGLANIFTAMVVGDFVWRKFIKKSNPTQFATTAVGVLICYVLFAIPIFGGLLVFIGLLWGLGGIWQAFRMLVSNK